MPTLAQTRAHEQRVHQIVTLALRDVSALWLAVQSEDADVVRDALADLVGPALEPYALAIGDLSAVFYDEVREIAGPRLKYLAAPAAPPAAEQVAAMARWSISPLYGVVKGDPLDRLAGGSQRLLAGVGRDTIYANAQADPAEVRYQRVPASGCCTFCGLMASRGGDYRSRESAEFVGGRGMPVESTKGRRGGQAKGIQIRGTQPRGARFHDKCRCGVAPVFEGQEQELPGSVRAFHAAYLDAPPGADLKASLASMRQTLGTR